MGLDTLQVFNELVIPAAVEKLTQNIALFNRVTGNAFDLTAGSFAGNFAETRFFRDLTSAVRRVDMNAPNTTVTPTDLTQIKQTAVKIAGAFGPVRYEPIALEWTRNPTGDKIVEMGGMLADGLLGDIVNTSIAATVAAMNNNTNARYGAAGATPMSYLTINSAHALFGDASSRIVANVMTGKTRHQLIGLNINNANVLFSSSTVNVVDMLNKVVVVTDAPALSTDGNDYVLGLTEGAITVTHAASNIVPNVETSNKNRIEHTLQFDYNYGLAIKGYSWNDAISSPLDAQLRTGTNWTQVATSIKNTAGVIAVAQAA